MFNPGSPITEFEHDSLGRSRFVRALANSLRDYRRPDSLCVGLFGNWGTGKSSVLNLTEKLLADDADKCSPIVVRFNPWNYSDQDQLVDQFFGQLLRVFSRPDLVRQYGAIRSDIKDLSAKVKSSSVPWPWGVGPAPMPFRRPTYLEGLRSSISRFLVHNNRRVIIIVDDIDRLNNLEIRQMFQLFKAVADFENVIYLLAFDRNVVEHALDSTHVHGAAAYLEKIVNIPLELPPITAAHISALLIKRLNETLGEKHSDYPWADNSRLSSVLTTLVPTFSTIRALERFLNLIRFAEPLISKEVDLTDLIAIVGLQVLVPNCYYFVRDSAELFVETPEGRLLRTSESERDAREAISQVINASANQIKPSRLRELLEAVFPYISNNEGRSDPSETTRQGWVREHRACANLKTFQTYFSLDVPDENISATEFMSILRGLEDGTFDVKVRRLIDQGKGIEFLELLKSFVDTSTVQRYCGTIVLTLFNISDEFQADIRGFPINLDGHTLIMQLVYQLVRRVESEVQRFNILRDAIRDSGGLFGIVQSISVEDQAAQRYNLGGSGDETRRLVNDEHLNLLEAAARVKIETWAAEGQLAGHAELAYILYRWSNWGGGDSLSSFVLNDLDDEQFVRLFTRLGMSTAQAQVSNRPQLFPGSVEPLAPLVAVIDRLRKINMPDRVGYLPDDVRHNLSILLETSAPR